MGLFQQHEVPPVARSNPGVDDVDGNVAAAVAISPDQHCQDSRRSAFDGTAIVHRSVWRMNLANALRYAHHDG